MFQGLATHHALLTKRLSLTKFSSLQLTLQSLEYKIANTPSPPARLLKERLDTLAELTTTTLSTFEGLRTRARAKWLEEGEKSSSYFHRLIAARRLSTSISKLSTPAGDIVSTVAEVTATCRNFYKNLYSRGEVSTDNQNSLLSFLKTSLSPEESVELDNAITSSEVIEAIRASANSSSPGQDGLPFEFYKAFAPMLAPFLASLFTDLLNGGALTPSASQSMITLIFKNKGSELDLKNWRPISLLNCDRKLLTKILATRLQKVAFSLIHPSQTGFVKGRLISDNTMAITQILDSYRESPQTDALVFLDQEKAYDCVDWSYLHHCLQAMKFGPKITGAILALHSGLNSSVLVNGFRSTSFTTQQGLPQGDPLSPILYNLVVEPFLS